MATALVTNLVSGALQRHYVATQAAFDALVAFVGTDAARMIELKLDPTKTFLEVEELAGTASLQSEMAGKRGGKWTGHGYVKPNALGVAPDIGPILKAAFGTETIGGGATVTYSLQDTPPTGGLQFERIIGSPGVAQDIGSGGWVETCDWEITGGQLPKINASGGYAFHAKGTATGVAAAGAAGGQGVIPLVAGQDGAFTIGSAIEFISGATHYNNTAAGYIVTAVTPSVSVPTITVTPVLEHALVENDLIVPYAPTPSVSGTILDGVQCYLTIDTVPLGFVSAKIQHKTGWIGLDKEATTDRANRLGLGAKRRITGNIDFYFLDTVTGPMLGKSWDGMCHDFILRIGPNTAASRCTLTWYGRIDLSPLNVPNADLATWSAKFVCRQKSAACDEFSVLLN